MSLHILPQDQTFWYLKEHDVEPLRQNLSTDVVVIGGGIAGLSAAQSFSEKGLDVVLLEKNYCGSGASGKSSGFIVPDSELPLSALMDMYGKDDARKLWEFVNFGVSFIQNNILKFDIKCDYQLQDTLVLASSKSSFTKTIKKEYETRSKLGYESKLYSQDQLSSALGSSSYYGGLSYTGTFSINAYMYCQGMKKVLKGKGVRIYEETPALEIADREVKTSLASIRAKHIIVCVDHFMPFLKRLAYEVYHVQTFLMISNPLSNDHIKAIFPAKNYMAWDTDLIYKYFRLTGDNRLLLGGGSLLYTYAKKEKHNSLLLSNKLSNYYKSKFPNLPITFEYIWPGLIGISKDLLPIAGHDINDSSIYYICAATGLPWAAALGNYSAESIINNETKLDNYFSPYRKFVLGHLAQSLLGTRLIFALSNFMRVGSL